MKLGKYTLCFEFWLPWGLGFGKGWGTCWFDIGPISVYWRDKDDS